MEKNKLHEYLTVLRNGKQLTLIADDVFFSDGFTVFINSETGEGAHINNDEIVYTESIGFMREVELK
jgi:hypothetical protein